METLLSNATKTNIANKAGSVVFKCPNCLNADIIRSAYERKIVAKYVCPSCGFEGPN